MHTQNNIRFYPCFTDSQVTSVMLLRSQSFIEPSLDTFQCRNQYNNTYYKFPRMYATLAHQHQHQYQPRPHFCINRWLLPARARFRTGSTVDGNADPKVPAKNKHHLWWLVAVCEKQKIARQDLCFFFFAFRSTDIVRYLLH